MLNRDVYDMSVPVPQCIINDYHVVFVAVQSTLSLLT